MEKTEGLPRHANLIPFENLFLKNSRRSCRVERAVMRQRHEDSDETLQNPRRTLQDKTGRNRETVARIQLPVF